MEHYSTHVIEQFVKLVIEDATGFDWLMNNGYKELVATLDAIMGDEKAFKFLMDNKHFILAAFISAIWDDEKAFKLLMDVKAFEWAACANIVNGDKKAEEFLKKSGNGHYILLAQAIQMRIRKNRYRWSGWR